MKLLTSMAFSAACLAASAQTPSGTPMQRKCGTVQQQVEQHDAFEEWIKTTIAKDNQFANAKKAAVAYNIPIVFHIIHSGAVTPARNISQAQVNSQIVILNNDYRKLNADFSTNVTQPAFVSAAADVQINFCAAAVDPSGTPLAEPGIDRINVTTKGWNALPYAMSYIESTVKPGSIWDPTKYFNVWVLQFGGSDIGTLGYAQFPTIPSGTTPINDMVGQGGSANTDGVVVDYRYVGNTGTATAPYNKGRTLTHETGHWLGLWHIWGDDTNCSGTDYVADTPNQQVENSSCPSTNGAVKTDACATVAPGFNYQNYMDYSDDKCMAMFTNGQKDRMQAVMANCIRRKTLNNAVACSTVTGIQEQIVGASVGIFPNPTSGEFTLHVEFANSQPFDVTVSNTLGQAVKTMSQVSVADLQIDLSGQAPGIYFINVKGTSGAVTKRVVLQ